MHKAPYFANVSAWHSACFDARREQLARSLVGRALLSFSEGLATMIIEKSGFLLMAGTLAAGGVGGWFVHDSKAHREGVTEVPVTTATASAAPIAAAPVVVVDQTPPPPLCDDSVGTADECPAVGPSDEGVCSNIAAKRCAEFKSTFKPKVAATAVSCLRHLKGNELCDPARVNLCGHAALMAACPDSPPVPSANGTSANGATVSANGVAAPAPTSAVAMACDTILKGCGTQTVNPSMVDCRQTLSGMSDFGRASMIACMATHCGDKGLLGCEGLKPPQ